MKKYYRNKQWVNGMNMPTPKPGNGDSIIVEETCTFGSKYKLIRKLHKFLFGQILYHNVTFTCNGVYTLNNDVTVKGCLTVGSELAVIKGKGTITLWANGSFVYKPKPELVELVNQNKAWWLYE